MPNDSIQIKIYIRVLIVCYTNLVQKELEGVKMANKQINNKKVKFIDRLLLLFSY